MSIKRVIFVYDRLSGELIDEITIDIALESLKTAVTPYEDDPDLIMSYEMAGKQLSLLQAFMSIDVDLLNNIYQMECYQE